MIRAKQIAGFIPLLAMCACAGQPDARLPAANFVSSDPSAGAADAESYVIGPLDQLSVFIWRNPELSTNVQVRPDGRITTPLITDLQAAGRTPAQLADDIKGKLATFVEDPRVSVIVNSFNGTFSQQIRIVGQAAKPAALPYRANMTLLDAMIAVGGLTEYAAGNRAKLVRVDKTTGKQVEYGLKIGSLLTEGKSSANVKLEPGDVIIIPESLF